MLGSPNSKVIGAFVIGFSMVAGAYTLSNFGSPSRIETAAVAAAIAPPRATIEVTDKDENGIEDWRDEFVNTEMVQLEIQDEATPYTPPDTLTGQLGLNLFEGFIRARSAGPFGQNQEEIVSNTVDALARETVIDLYDTKHISILTTWNEADIRNYANAMAGAITRNDVRGLENELFILEDVVNRNKPERIDELKTIAEVYRRTLDDSLAVPVPQLFVKQHLDLLNTYNALYKDIEAMTLSFKDPAVTLLRLKRYQDDVLGLELALENMYSSFEPYTGLFSPSDPALLFVVFNPDNQGPR